MYEAFSYTHFSSNIRPPVACKSREVFIIRWQLSRTVPVWPTSKSTVFKRSFKSDGVTHCIVLVRLGGRRLVSISGNLIQSCSVPPSFYNKLQVLDVINCKRTLQFNGCCSMNSLKGMTRSAGVQLVQTASIPLNTSVIFLWYFPMNNNLLPFHQTKTLSTK
jgi:hypothetical protein